jgi:hypothetical protein
MVNESGAAVAASPHKPPAQSPWKNPKVSLMKTKSIKRKSDIFNLNGLSSNNSVNPSPLSQHNINHSYSNQELDNQTPQNKKGIFNKFSISNSTGSFNNVSNNYAASTEVRFYYF